METLHFRIHEILNDKFTDYLRTSAIKKILLIDHDKDSVFSAATHPTSSSSIFQISHRC